MRVRRSFRCRARALHGGKDGIGGPSPSCEQEGSGGEGERESGGEEGSVVVARGREEAEGEDEEKGDRGDDEERGNRESPRLRAVGAVEIEGPRATGGPLAGGSAGTTFLSLVMPLGSGGRAIIGAIPRAGGNLESHKVRCKPVIK